jgi:hypothetical protein
VAPEEPAAKPNEIPPMTRIITIEMAMSVLLATAFMRRSHGPIVGYSKSALAVPHSPQRT